MDNQAIFDEEMLSAIIGEIKVKGFESDESLCGFIADKIGAGLHIKVDGTGYNSSFPASFAQSLVEIQNNFYRAISFALFGEENLKRLTAEKRKQYELVFVVSKGSTEVESDYKQSLIQLCRDMLKDMPPTTKAVTLITLAGLLAGTVIMYRYIDHLSETDKENQQTTRLVKTIDKLAENQERNIAAILKGARDADAATINGRTFDREAIIEANQRADRVPQSSDAVRNVFRIVTANTREQGSIDKFTLTAAGTGEFTAIFDEDNFPQEQIDKVWTAIKNKQQIELSLTLVKQGNQIKQSVITAVH